MVQVEAARNSTRRVFCASVIAAVVLFGSVGVAHAGWFKPEQRLTTHEADQIDPEISGTKIAYADYRNVNEVGDPNDPDQLFDIRVLDLKTLKSKNLTPHHNAYMGPAISGDRVVWQGIVPGTSNIAVYYYNLGNHTTKRLPIHGQELQISGPRVVYDAYRSGDYRIYVYNIQTKKETLVADGANGNAVWPDISGKKVVWLDFRNGNQDIYSYDLAAKQERRLTFNTEDQTHPRISGDRVVWQDSRNDVLNRDIYMYDLATNTEQRITTDAGDQHDGTVGGDTIAWQDDRGGDSEIYMYDLASGLEKRVTVSPASSDVGVSVSGSRMVYMSNGRPGITGQDLYLTSTVDPKLTASTPSTVAYDTGTNVIAVLKDAAGSPLIGKSVTVQVSPDKKVWQSGGTATTNIEGRCSVLSPGITSRCYIRVRFAGDADFRSAVSVSVLVKPQVDFVDAPALSTTTLESGTRYAVSGEFEPKHATASTQVRVKVYRYLKRSDGVWAYVYQKTFATETANDAGPVYSTYNGHVHLHTKGSWRIRAYHPADTGNAATYSDYRYVTVE